VIEHGNDPLQPDGTWAIPAARVVPAVLRARPADPEPVAEHRPGPPPPRTVSAPPPPRPVTALLSRRVFGLPLTLGQLAGWQVVLVLVGVSVGRPLPVFAPAMGCAAVILALTAVRFRDRWLYQWVSHYGRFRRRERVRRLPREDGPRAVLHLFAPDAMVTAVRLGSRDGAVVNRPGGAAALVHLEPAGAGSVTTLPWPRQLFAAGGLSGVAVQVVLHGVSERRPVPAAWLAVQAVRTPTLSDDDDLVAALAPATERILADLTAHGVRAALLDRAETLRAVVALAHVSDDRREVRERWRSWRCGPVAQAAFRLVGWAELPGPAGRRLLERLLTQKTGGVVTVSLTAGAAEPESALVRAAAAGTEELSWVVRRLRAMAAEHHVRLVRLDGEHADGVAAVMPLGPLR
jgi:ESX secretion system protein EccE